VPLVAGGVLELPLGTLADEGRRRRRAVLGGGLVFIVSLFAAAAARSFIVLLAAFTVFFPASGAFVSLTQAELMDAWPERQAQVMARWDLAGSTGSVAGPLLLTAVLAAGGGWRAVYVVLAALAAVTWLGTWRFEPGPVRAATAGSGAGPGSGGGPGSGSGPGSGLRWAARAREVVAALRDWSTVRWVVLIEVADLLVDVLTGFLALYLVDVAHLAPPIAALAIAIRFGSGLAADMALVAVLDRVTDVTVLLVSAVAAGLLYPGFLLAPGPVAKLVMLAVLSAATAPWYPLLQARLYGSLPGRSPVAVTLSSAAGLAAGLGPLAVGLIAEAFGLTRALAVLVVVPAAVLAGSAAARRGESGGAGGAGGASGPAVGPAADSAADRGPDGAGRE
jgi:MFS transporter, FSR family, fosmidomycin resistance protein